MKSCDYDTLFIYKGPAGEAGETGANGAMGLEVNAFIVYVYIVICSLLAEF